MVVATGFGDGDCGCPFAQGGEFLVYAFTDTSQGKKRLYTHICARTMPLREARDDLEALGAGKAVR